jgi:ligand-binding SRPBCC domain-containing protein
MIYHLERSIFIPRARAEVFAFFSDAHNLERITPGFLRFRILTPDPIGMRPGTLIEYQIRLYGIPVRWKTRIAEFDPDRVFVDVQLSGPYRSWHHRHSFNEVPGGTEMHDHVDYEMRFGVLGSLGRRLFVRSALERIFDHRNAAIKEYFKDG